MSVEAGAFRVAIDIQKPPCREMVEGLQSRARAIDDKTLAPQWNESSDATFAQVNCCPRQYAENHRESVSNNGEPARN